MSVEFRIDHPGIGYPDISSIRHPNRLGDSQRDLKDPLFWLEPPPGLSLDTEASFPDGFVADPNYPEPEKPRDLTAEKLRRMRVEIGKMWRFGHEPGSKFGR